MNKRTLIVAGVTGVVVALAILLMLPQQQQRQAQRPQLASASPAAASESSAEQVQADDAGIDMAGLGSELIITSPSDDEDQQASSYQDDGAALGALSQVPPHLAAEVNEPAVADAVTDGDDSVVDDQRAQIALEPPMMQDLSGPPAKSVVTRDMRAEREDLEQKIRAVEASCQRRVDAAREEVCGRLHTDSEPQPPSHAPVRKAKTRSQASAPPPSLARVVPGNVTIQDNAVLTGLRWKGRRPTIQMTADGPRHVVITLEGATLGSPVLQSPFLDHVAAYPVGRTLKVEYRLHVDSKPAYEVVGDAMLIRFVPSSEAHQPRPWRVMAANEEAAVLREVDTGRVITVVPGSEDPVLGKVYSVNSAERKVLTDIGYIRD